MTSQRPQRLLAGATALAPSGGVEMTVFQVTRELSRRGHVVDVAAREGGALEPELRSFCRTVSVTGDYYRYMGSPRQFARADFYRWLARAARAARAARRLRPEVIWAQGFLALPWAVMAAGRSGCRLVCHLHASNETPIGLQARALAARVDRFVAVSEAVRRDWLTKGLAPSRVTVVHNGVSPADYPPSDEVSRRGARLALGLPPDAFVVLFLGRLSPEKGVDVLLAAWRRLGLPPEAARLLVVGPADGAGRSGPGRRPPAAGVTFHPTTTDVVPVLHAADVLAVPSRAEAFGRTAVEAMATGCPVVASSVGGLPEILTGRFASQLVPPGDADALARRLGSMAGWRRRDARLASACVAHVRHHFSLDAMVDALEGVFAPAGC